MEDGDSNSTSNADCQDSESDIQVVSDASISDDEFSATQAPSRATVNQKRTTSDDDFCGPANAAPLRHKRTKKDEYIQACRTVGVNSVKRTELLEKLIDQTEPIKSDVDLYFDSLKETMKKFSPVAQIHLKVEMTNLMSKYEMQHLQSFSANSNISFDSGSSYMNL